MQETRFDPWVGKIHWRRKWQPTQVFLPGKSHGQRSLAGYSPWGHKESDITERLKTAKENAIFFESRKEDLYSDTLEILWVEFQTPVVKKISP